MLGSITLVMCGSGSNDLSAAGWPRATPRVACLDGLKMWERSTARQTNQLRVGIDKIPEVYHLLRVALGRRHRVSQVTRVKKDFTGIQIYSVGHTSKKTDGIRGLQA